MLSKKILSLFLVFVICFTAMPVAFAADEAADIVQAEENIAIEEGIPADENIPVDEETPTDEEIPEDEDIPSDDDTSDDEDNIIDEEPGADEDIPFDENEVVADFYVFLVESSVHPIGHTWVYIENLTDRELRVGLYKLPAHEGVAVGVLARKDGWGVYYNVESYSQTVYGMKNQVSLKDTLTVKELEKVSKTIVNFVNHWDPIFNCMYFAFKVWNSGSNQILIPLILPIFGKIQMLLHNHEKNVQMKPVTREQTFRQVGFNNWATMTSVSDASLGKV